MKRPFIFIITNVATEQIIEVMSNRFKVAGTSTNETGVEH
jgi:hypothetical protein